MKTSLIALFAASALVAASGSAMAADLMIEVPDAPVIDNSFDWEGAYLGAFVGYHANLIFGGEVGYNMMASEMVLVGVTASGFIETDGDTELWIDGRVGGTFDNVLLYANGGLGVYNLGTAIWRVGVGAEIAVTDNVSLNAQLGLDDAIGSVPSNIYANVGVRFHF